MALPSPETKRETVRTMFDRIAGEYDRMNKLMTLGFDRHWRIAGIRALGLTPASTVVDIACGTGDFCKLITQSGATPVGIDSSPNMLAVARSRLGPRSALVEADAADMPFQDGSIDAATCGFALRNFVNLQMAFDEMARVVRVGGEIALVDVGRPSNKTLATAHSLYFERVMPALGAMLSDRAAYRYLPASTEYLPDPADIATSLMRSGFSRITHKTFGLGSVHLFVATRGDA